MILAIPKKPPVNSACTVVPGIPWVRGYFIFVSFAARIKNVDSLRWSRCRFHRNRLPGLLVAFV
jgi:hypothetical protein